MLFFAWLLDLKFEAITHGWNNPQKRVSGEVSSVSIVVIIIRSINEGIKVWVLSVIDIINTKFPSSFMSFFHNFMKLNAQI